jgi:hypothetical protein
MIFVVPPAPPGSSREIDGTGGQRKYKFRDFEFWKNDQKKYGNYRSTDNNKMIDLAIFRFLFFPTRRDLTFPA